MNGLFTGLAAKGNAPRLQRACDCANKGPEQGECEECKKKRPQRRAAGPGSLAAPRLGADALPAGGLAAFERGGAPLAPAWRRRVEPLFGTGFDGVRVHDDAASHAAARSLNAHAFTVGQHVHFAAGRYAPASRDGLHLLAHELAHTVQQRGAAAADSAAPQRDAIEVDGPGAPLERDADAHADAVVAGRATRVHAGGAAGSGAGVAARLQRLATPVGEAVEEDRPAGDGSGGGMMIRRTLEQEDCTTTPDKQSTPRDQIFKWDTSANAIKLDYTMCSGSVKLTAKTSIDYTRVIDAGKDLLNTLRTNPAAGGNLPALAGNAIDSATINQQGEVALTVDGVLRASVGAESTLGTAQQSIRVTGQLKVTPNGVSFKITGSAEAQRTPLLAAEKYSLSLKVGTKWFVVDVGYKLDDQRPVGGAATKRSTVEIGTEIPLPIKGLPPGTTLGPTVSIDTDTGRPTFGGGIKGTFGGAEKTDRVSCWRCECPPPKPKYQCTPYGTKKVIDRAQVDRRVPLMYSYNSTAPADAKAFKGSVGSVASMVGEGYEVRSVRGHASPEGTRDYNLDLSKRRASHAHAELTGKVPAGTTLPAPEGAGELFGDSAADAEKEAADRDLTTQLVAELAGKNEQERLALLEVGDDVRNDPDQRKKALEDIEAFVQGKDKKGALKQRPRWEKVFPFMRRVDVQMRLAEISHPERDPKPDQAGACGAEDRAYIDERKPIPPEHRLPTKKCRE